MNRFRDKVSSLKASGDRRLRSERERLYNKVRQMEQEIALLENNIGFFANSKNADALVADVRAKIDPDSYGDGRCNRKGEAHRPRSLPSGCTSTGK